jgi:ABC-type antimicrobial peptide transport system permease subunit
MRDLVLVIQTRGDGQATLLAAKSAVRALDASVPVEDPTDMTDVVRASTARERFLTTLLTVFALLALVIATVGVFGMVSFTVARQRREFAIRTALGAGRAQVLRAVLLHNGAVAGAGAALGTLTAALAAPALQSFLYGTAPRDVLVLTCVPLALVAVALLACAAPALRATRAAPAHVLQESE